MTPHPSVLTSPPYKNKQDYKGGTNDKTRDSHTRETSVSQRFDDSSGRNLDSENKNTKNDEYNDHLSIKKIKFILNHMKKSEKYYYLKINLLLRGIEKRIVLIYQYKHNHNHWCCYMK